MMIAENKFMQNQRPNIGFVSLGCPKNLVDSERILTELRTDGYNIVPSYENVDLVIVNTCGFIDSACAGIPRSHWRGVGRKWTRDSNRLFGCERRSNSPSSPKSIGSERSAQLMKQ